MLEEKGEKEGAISDELDFGIWLMGNIKIILDCKKLIAIIMTGCLLLGLVMSLWVIKPLYQSQAEYIVSIPELIETPYGMLTFPSRKLEDYWNVNSEKKAIKMTLNELKGNYTESQLESMINININSSTSNLTIAVKAKDPKEAYRIVNIHEKSFLGMLNFTLQRIVLSTFIEMENREVLLMGKTTADLKKEFVGAKNLLESTPKTLLVESAMLDKNQAELYYSDLTKQELEQYKDKIILSQVINPSYEKICKLIGQLEIDINSAENKWNIAKLEVEKLTKQKAGLEESILDNKNSTLTIEGINLQETIMSLLYSPQINDESTSMSRFMIVAISLAGGLIIGVFVAFLLAFWRKIRTIV